MAKLAPQQPCFCGNVLRHYRHDGCGLKVVNDNRPNAARSVVLNRDHLCLPVIGALFWLIGFVAYRFRSSM